MKFFTPELYSRYNSPDLDVAEAAESEWDAAAAAYQEHFQAIVDRLGSQTRTFFSTSCFHDSEVLEMRELIAEECYWATSRPEPGRDRRPVRFFVFVLRSAENLTTVTYVLRRSVGSTRHDAQVFASARKFWLFDELVIDPIWLEERRGAFAAHEDAPPKPELVHSILFSDGSEVVLAFSEVFAINLPLARICDESLESAAGAT